ncbi:MAG: ECF transporter S component [Lachnospiraceae bacterium]|nr:ECF transporter S component [Lachnospiraceae bacterium]
MKCQNNRIYKLSLSGLMAALSYVVFTFLQIKITLPGGDATSIHLGNAICVLGGLLLGGAYGGIGGAIGMTIGDLFDPVYVLYAPKTFLLKFCIGYITGFIAHKCGKISTSNDTSHVLKWTILATVSGLLFNVVFDPLVGYYYKLCILGKPAAELTLAWNVTATSINAILSAFVSVIVYMTLRPAMRKANLLPAITKLNIAK